MFPIPAMSRGSIRSRRPEGKETTRRVWGGRGPAAVCQRSLPPHPEVERNRRLVHPTVVATFPTLFRPENVPRSAVPLPSAPLSPALFRLANGRERLLPSIRISMVLPRRATAPTPPP